MPLLAGTHYDPSTAVSKSTAAALAMTAIDTTNLRLTFNAPANGIVQVRISAVVHGATTFPQILLGVLDGSTVKGRKSPIGNMKATDLATAQLGMEAVFLVTGLTPTQSYTWDAAYGVETTPASTGVKYGGPNNATTNDAWGGITFEIWDTPNLLAGVLYDPSSAVSKVTDALLAMTAMDTTNLRLTFTAPASGIVRVRLNVVIHGAATYPQILLGVLDGSTVKGRMSPIGGIRGHASTSTHATQEVVFLVTGLTPSQSYTWDAAYGVEIILAATAIKYGGPDNTTANDAFGGIIFEIWDVPELLAGKLYDPSSAVTETTAGSAAMVAMDTTNLRLTFTAPANGIVQVRIACIVHGATTFPQILLGVMDGSTIKGRISPTGGRKATNVAVQQLPMEALFLVTGLTPSQSYTFDAGLSVVSPVASTGVKYGGPNNATSNDAFGGIAFEIWDTPNLITGKLYDPSSIVNKVLTAVAMTAFDTTNLRLTFNAPASGKVMVRLGAVVVGQTTFSQILLGVLESSTVKGRACPIGGFRGSAAAVVHAAQEVCFLINGLTPSQSYTFDAAWASEVNVAASEIKYGGPNDINPAYGGVPFEIWDVVA